MQALPFFRPNSSFPCKQPLSQILPTEGLSLLLSLLEVCHTGLKDLHVLVAVNIDGYGIATSLCMTHLSEYTAIRTRDSFDGCIGAVYIPLFVLHTELAIRIHITGCHLSIGKELLQPLFVCHKAALTMRSGDRIGFTELSQSEPRRLVADHLRVNHLGNVTADGVEGQCRRILFLTTDLAIGNQSQLDQGLEAIADTKTQAISLILQLHDRFLDLGIAECGCKEFRRTIGLITG